MGDPGSDDGYSLIELMVVMALLLVVTASVGDTIVRSLHTQSDLTLRGSLLDSSRRAMERTTRDLRDATLVRAATPTSLTLERDTAAGQVLQLAWSVQPGAPVDGGPAGTAALVLTTTGTNADGSAVAPTTATVLAGLDPKLPVFGYAPRDGYTPADPTVVDAGSCLWHGPAATTYAPECIGEVQLTLVLPTVQGQPVHLSDTVELRNTKATT